MLIGQIVELCVTAFREIEAVPIALLLAAIFKLIISNLLVILSRQALLVVLTTGYVEATVILFRIKFLEDVRQVLKPLQRLVDRIMLIFFLERWEFNAHEIEKTVIEVGGNRIAFSLDVLS